MIKLVKLLTFGILFAGTALAADLECPVCYEVYKQERIAIQLDCNQSVNHHACLECANKLKECIYCQSTTPFKVHDPRIGNSNKKIHHLYRDLTSNEQMQLKKLLNKAPKSDKPTPDAIDSTCQACNIEHDSEILVRFTCSHALCLPEALKLAQSGKSQCPTCKKKLILVDPIKKENGHIELMYQNRIAKSYERPSLEQLRSYGHIPVYQDHISKAKRVPITKAKKPSHKAPRKKKASRPATLPVVPELYLDIPLTADDIRLTNTYLPARLSPTVWQVVVMPNGTYARARRVRELAKWPSKATTQAAETNLFNRHTLTGFACGFLAGQELGEGNNNNRRLLYIPALLYSAFDLYESHKKDNTQTFANSCKWGIGLILGALASLYKTNKQEAV